MDSDSECVNFTQAELGDLGPSGLFWVHKGIVAFFSSSNKSMSQHP